jgi:DNA modification methylase
MEMKSQIGTIASVLMVALARNWKNGSGNKKRIFAPENSPLPLLEDELRKANQGLIDGTLEGVEIAGNSFDLYKLLDNKSVQTIITSPPYFSMRNYSVSDDEVGSQGDPELYVDKMVNLFIGLKDKLKDNGTLVVNIDAGGSRDYNKLTVLNEFFATKMVKSGHYLLDQKLIVNKPDVNQWWNSDSRPNPTSEMIYVFTKNTPENANKGTNFKKYNQLLVDTNDKTGKKRISHVIGSGFARVKKWNSRQGFDDMWVRRFPEFASDLFYLKKNNFQHPAPMNKSLAWKLIQLYSDPGDVVLDPFSGAGNTSKTAKICGRIGIGFELNLMFSRTAVIGEYFTKSMFENLSKQFVIADTKNHPRSNKHYIKIPVYDPSKYDPKKTMWINAVHLGFSN